MSEDGDETVFSRRTLLMRLFISLSTVLLTLGWVSSAKAQDTLQSKYRLKIKPSAASGICPAYFDVIETIRLYEGGAETRATVWLQWMAGAFSVSNTTSQSVTWIAKLKTQYKNCKAYASISTLDGYPVEGMDHLRARFAGGSVSFTLDISSFGEYSAITWKGIEGNNPSYSWAVAD